MGKKRSDLELLMRDIGLVLGLGFQFHYRDRRWELQIWDQRPGHYTKLKPGDNGYNSDPSQKWYNNQNSDYFEQIYDKKDPQRKREKDEFIYYLLVESDEFYQKLPMLKTHSLEGLLFYLDVIGKETDEIRKKIKKIFSLSSKKTV